MKSFNFAGIRLLAGLAVLWTTSALAGIADPAQRPADHLSVSQRPVLLDVTRAGARLVAVGERGVILVSTDQGKSWKQAPAPVAVTLTAVQFITPSKGWVLGHSGIVLYTSDAGESWVRQLDGVMAAQAELRAAQTDTTQGAENRLKMARRLVADGADKPFLAMAFENDMRGVIVGAYGLVFGTEDGGKTWTSWLDRVPNPKGLHLYAVQRDGGDLYLAGEQGLFLRSRDGGRSFSAIETPYRGSYFVLAASGPGQMVMGGLRGNAYRFDARADSFHKLDVPIPVSLSASTRLPDGRLMFINQAGQWLIGAGDALLAVPAPPGAPAIAVAATTDGGLVMATWRGAMRVALPAPSAPSAAMPVQK